MPAITLSDGARLTYRDAGRGPVLLFVHGWGVNGNFFKAQIDGLSDRFRVIVPDLRGHGDTPAAEPMTIERLAEDMIELTDALNLERVLGVGWSLGAMVLWSALQGPGRDRFAGMVAIDMAPRIVSDGGWKLGVKSGYDSSVTPLLQQAMLADWPAYGRHLAQALVAEGTQDEKADLLDWTASEVARNDPAPLARLWGSLSAQDFRDTLGDLDLPVLVAHGAQSQLYGPETAKDLAERLPRARIVAFQASGHAPPLEEPEAFNSAIADFAREVAG